MTLSPEGIYFNFEFAEKGRFWVQTDPGTPMMERVYDSRAGRTKLVPAYKSYPKYEERTGQEYNAIAIIRPGDMITNDQYGNSAFYPPSFPFRGTTEIYKKVGIDMRAARIVEGPLIASIGLPRIRSSLEAASLEEAHRKFSIKRDARFLTWQKANSWQLDYRLVALIYQTENGWGPIEIRDAEPYSCLSRSGTVEIPESESGSKPGIWEIPVSLNDCRSLAWKPDGSLTYLSNGKVFSISGNRILEGIKESGVKHIGSYNGKFADFRIPMRNVFEIEPELVAYGIDGDRLHWVTNDTFLFRDEEGRLKNICSWHQERIERLCQAPEEFSYCDQPPLGFSGTIPNIASSKDRVEVGLTFFVGSIETRWDNHQRTSVSIRIGTRPNQEVLSFAFPTETNLEDIRNPAKYDYFVRNEPYVIVPLSQIILLRLGERYAAIKPLTLEPRKGQENESAPYCKWMTCEWKYWSQSVKIDANEKNKNELADKSLLPTMGKEVTSGNQIAVGNVQIIWEKTFWGKNLNTNSNVVGIGFRSELLPAGSKAEWTSIVTTYQVLESIIDPSKYRYFPFSTNSKSGTQGIIKIGCITIFKVGDKYVAIKPIELKKQGANESLVYEWKYWPTLSTKLASVD